MDALMRDLLPVIEFAAKAARTALAHVGAAIDCGMPAASAQRAHAAAGAFGPIDSAVPLPAETVPAGVSAGVQTTVPPAGLSWVDWAVPAICDVLANHRHNRSVHGGVFYCHAADGEYCGTFEDQQEWREHVSPLIAQRLETAALALDPAKSARESDQRIAFALGLFEQHRKPQ